MAFSAGHAQGMAPISMSTPNEMANFGLDNAARAAAMMDFSPVAEGALAQAPLKQSFQNLKAMNPINAAMQANMMGNVANAQKPGAPQAQFQPPPPPRAPAYMNQAQLQPPPPPPNMNMAELAAGFRQGGMQGMGGMQGYFG
jgi:hypothetical protein